MIRKQGGFNSTEAVGNPNSGSSLDQQALREFRKARFENQTRFWARFGVTQSRGSRFEMGVEIPPPVTILLNLYITGVVSDQDLGQALSGNDSAPHSGNKSEMARSHHG